MEEEVVDHDYPESVAYVREQVEQQVWVMFQTGGGTLENSITLFTRSSD
jgi:hypothetical protein